MAHRSGFLILDLPIGRLNMFSKLRVVFEFSGFGSPTSLPANPPRRCIRIPKTIGRA